MVAGHIGTTLNVPPTNLSFHLKALTHTGLLTVEQEGRFQRYRANISLMLDLMRILPKSAVLGILNTAWQYARSQPLAKRCQPRFYQLL